MRLLIVTQALDGEDPALSFFVRWVNELSRHYVAVSVVCLKKGAYSLPLNVDVYSLGKEEKRSRMRYVLRFFRYIVLLVKDYDAVLVHQNQEYVILAGWFWKLFGKPVYMWRNHYEGSWLTDVSMTFCRKIFYTSKFSYTATHSRAVLMPVGVDTAFFKPSPTVARPPNSILFLARISPSKRPHLLIEALKLLRDAGIKNFYCNIVGDALPRDIGYFQKIQKAVNEYGVGVSLLPGIPNVKTPVLYSAHDVFVNLSPSGMYDKTLFEAAACGCLVVASSKDFSAHVKSSLSFADNDASSLAHTLQGLFRLAKEQRMSLHRDLKVFAEENNLVALAERLTEEMKST